MFRRRREPRASGIPAKLATLALIALVAASAAAPALGGLRTRALTGVGLELLASRVVAGQDLLLVVSQTGGSFAPGARVYFQLSSTGSWSGSGYYLLGLEPGSTTLPPGTLVYIPRGSPLYPHSPGGWKLLLSDSPSGSSGVASAAFQVEEGAPPVIAVNGTSRPPSSQVAITYTSVGPASAVPSMSAILEASPGDVLRVDGALFRGSMVTIYFLYIYSNEWGDGFIHEPLKLAVASLSGGGFSVHVRLPDAPEGIHAILAVDDKGYYAFTFIYVKPRVDASPASIRGLPGDTLTVEGRGFPANAKISSVTLIAAATGRPLGASLVSGGAVDSFGRVSFTLKLADAVPADSLGPLSLRVAYDPTAPGHDFPYDPDNDIGGDSFRFISTASNPQLVGAEALFVLQGLASSVNSLQMHVGDEIDIIVANYPPHSRVSLYLGPAKLGTVETDSNGAARLSASIPELPGYDGSGFQVSYPLRAIGPNGLVSFGVPYAPSYSRWSISIEPLIVIEYEGVGKGLKYVPPNATIKVRGTGLAPYDVVEISETIAGNTYNVLQYWWLYSAVVLEGKAVADAVEATATGSFEVAYRASYGKLDPAPATGAQVLVSVSARETPGVGVAQSYYEVAAPALALYTASDAGYPTAEPLEQVRLRVGPGLVPSGNSPAEVVVYTVYVDGSPATAYNASTMARVDYMVARSSGDAYTLTLYAPQDQGPHRVSVRPSCGACGTGEAWLVVSKPSSTASSEAHIEVLPGYERVPAGSASLLVAGWGFEAHESSLSPVYLGISGVGRVYVDVDNKGAFLVDLAAILSPGGLRVPSGSYAVYAKRTLPGASQVTPDIVEVEPSASISGAAGLVHVGDEITINAHGLQPGGVYRVVLSPTIRGPGIPLRAPDGSPLIVVASEEGSVTWLSAVVPPALPYNTYYVCFVPATGGEVAAVPVHLLPAKGFRIAGYTDFYSPLQYLTLEARGASGILSGFLGVRLTPSDVGRLLATGRVLARLEPLNGTSGVITAAAASYDESRDALAASVLLPDVNATGVYGVYLRIVNGTLDTGWMPVTGVLLGSTGGALLRLGVVEEDIVAIKTGLGVVLARLGDLNATLESIRGGVAEIQTSLGAVVVNLSLVRDMLGEINATIVGEAGSLEALISSKVGEVRASLDALAEIVSGGLLEINGSLARIEGGLANVSMGLDSLRELLQTVGDTLELRIENYTEGLADLIALKSGEVVANLSVYLQELAPLIVDINGSLARLETTLGEAMISLSELKSGQAEIERLVRNESGRILAEVRVGTARINATLEAASRLLLDGVASARLNIISELARIYGGLNSTDKRILAMLLNLEDELAAQNKSIEIVSNRASNISRLLEMLYDNVEKMNDTLIEALNASSSAASEAANLSGEVKVLEEQLGTTLTLIRDSGETLKSIDSTLANLSQGLNGVSRRVHTTGTQATLLAGVTAALATATLTLIAIVLRRLTTAQEGIATGSSSI